MRVVIPFCSKDISLCWKLLEWICEFKDNKFYPCLLVYPKNLDDKAKKIADLASESFSTVSMFKLDSKSDSMTWPAGPNYSFSKVIKLVQDRAMGSFLWLEPDSVPLKRGWLDDIFKEYMRSNMAFMGSINSNKGLMHLSGVAVYPQNAHEFWEEHLPSIRAFDMVGQDRVIAHTHNSRLIQNFFGKMGMDPIFKENLEKSDPINTLTLAAINKEAVLFHRCKTGNLIDLLRKQKAYEIRQA